MSLVWAQIRAIIRIEMKKTFFAKRGLWIYIPSSQQLNAWLQSIKGATPTLAKAYLAMDAAACLLVGIAIFRQLSPRAAEFV